MAAEAACVDGRERRVVSTESGTAVPPRTAGGGRSALLVYTALCWMLVALVIGQVFLAGVGVMVDADGIAAHRNAGRVIWAVSALLPVAAAAARLPRRRVLAAAAPVVLILLQFVFVHLPTDGTVRFLRALHTVNALAILWETLRLAQDARRRLSATRDVAA